jgi:hypothetical protein
MANLLDKVGTGTQSLFNVIPKEIRVGISIAGAGVLAYVLYKMVTKTDEEKAEDQLSKETGSKSKLTLQLSRYKSLADNLYDAFQYAWGTDEDSIYQIIAMMKTKEDVLQLVKDFGYRRKEFEFGTYGLPYFMRDELDTQELNQVNNILAKNKINYKF